MLAIWSVRGGAGVTVVAASAALAGAPADGRSVLLVDLDGDAPAVLGIPEPHGPGLAEWSHAPSDVPVDALGRLEVPVAPGVSLLPSGAGGLAVARTELLAALLAADPRRVVADLGRLGGDPGRVELARRATRSLLVTSACPPALRRLGGLDPAPTGVVVVHRHRCATPLQEVADATGAPVVAEIDHDPALARAIDLHGIRRPPRRLRRALRGLW